MSIDRGVVGWVVALLAVIWVSATDAHVDSPYLTDECGSCHVGHGLPGQPMLGYAEEQFCYQCHGSDLERDRMVAEGRLVAGAPLTDIEREFEKMYRHPVQQTGAHSATEELPRPGLAMGSHAECVDCHSPHERIHRPPTASREVSGFTLSGQIVDRSASETEVCLKCHSDRSFVDADRIAISEEFGLAAISQHPVSRMSDGRPVPSLRVQVDGTELMRCSDCHTNDDSEGPRGPHGSRYRFLLSGNYEIGHEVAESPHAYEFCYSCHDRSSLLSGDSFPLHRLHIQGSAFRGGLGTSCFTCHASHGSVEYPHLLRFTGSAIKPETGSRQIRYVDLGDRAGQCWLYCHGTNHAGSRY